MWAGLILAYGFLAFQSLMFILPKRRGPKTRPLFVGRIAEFEMDSVRAVRDLQGTPILIKRGGDGFRAFSSVCPHLGCRVRWEPEPGPRRRRVASPRQGQAGPEVRTRPGERGR